jgi:hypothetical protein
MKRQIPGLRAATSADTVLEGLFLVRVEQAHYNWHRQSFFLLIRFAVLEPKQHSSRSITGRIYCTPKALWRLNWFLRDFGYDTDLLVCDEVDEKALLGLRGVIRTSRRNLAGRSYLNLDGFAPAAQWEELSVGCPARSAKDDGSDDLQLHTN